jgi:hypothetical protein
MKIGFQEEQKFTQWWLWLILIGIGLIPLYGIYTQLIIGEKFGDKPMSDVGLVFFALFTFAFLALFWLMRLKTKINENEINMNFFPFIKKSMLWNEIKSAKIVKYGFVGYGIRLGSDHGTVYNTKGNKGLAIVLKSGKKLLIGTQKSAELKTILEKISLKHYLS